MSTTFGILKMWLPSTPGWSWLMLTGHMTFSQRSARMHLHQLPAWRTALELRRVTGERWLSQLQAVPNLSNNRNGRNAKPTLMVEAWTRTDTLRYTVDMSCSTWGSMQPGITLPCHAILAQLAELFGLQTNGLTRCIDPWPWFILLRCMVDLHRSFIFLRSYHTLIPWPADNFAPMGSIKMQESQWSLRVLAFCRWRSITISSTWAESKRPGGFLVMLRRVISSSAQSLGPLSCSAWASENTQLTGQVQKVWKQLRGRRQLDTGIKRLSLIKRLGQGS